MFVSSLVSNSEQIYKQKDMPVRGVLLERGQAQVFRPFLPTRGPRFAPTRCSTVWRGVRCCISSCFRLNTANAAYVGLVPSSSVAAPAHWRHRSTSLSMAQPQPQPQPAYVTKLNIVLDLDETLIIFNSLLNGRYAADNAFSADDTAAARALGDAWQDIILDVLDVHFYFEALESEDVINLQDVLPAQAPASPEQLSPMPAPAPTSVDEPQAQQPLEVAEGGGGARPAKRLCTRQLDETQAFVTIAAAVADSAGTAALASPSGDAAGGYGAAFGQPGSQLSSEGDEDDSPGGPLAALDAASRARLYKLVWETYESGVTDLRRCMAPELVARWDSALQRTDALTGGWLTHARKLLAGLSSCGAHVETGHNGYELRLSIVSTGHLVATLGKLLLFDLASFIPALHVFSASKDTKLTCFRRIEAQFGGASARFCAVGDGAEEAVAAAVLRWPFVKIVLGASKCDGRKGEHGDLMSGDGLVEGCSRVAWPVDDAVQALAAQACSIRDAGQRLDEVSAESIIKHALECAPARVT